MQQIMEMASAMGISEPTEEMQTDEPQIQEALQHVSQFLHQAEEKDKKQQTLMRALLPYLSPGRQKKLERAMQLSRLSRLAGAAIQGAPNSLSQPEEVLHV